VKPPGIVVTFYSFKGGVGRSMALANVAVLLARKGHRVVCCDADLEAPGLEDYLASSSKHAEELRQRPGLVELLAEYREAVARDPEQAGTPQAGTGARFLDFRGVRLPRPSARLVDLEHAGRDARGARLRLMTAGARGASSLHDYATEVRRFDWEGFYERWAGGAFVELLREDLCGEADFVLIDSRTGVTELGGVCTHHLADVVVLLTNATQASLEGTKRMAHALRGDRLRRLRDGRPLEILPVAARIELTAETESLARFRRDFRGHFGARTSSHVGPAEDFLCSSEIPYIPKYGFGERLVASEDESTRSEELHGALAHLAEAVELCHARLRPTIEPATAAAPRRSSAHRHCFVLRDFSIPDVSMTLGLLQRRVPGVTVPGLGTQSRQGQLFRDVVKDALESADSVLVLVDKPNCNVAFELGYALGRGKPAALAAAGAKVPAWLNHAPFGGHLVRTGIDTDALAAQVTSDEWLEPPGRGVPGQDTLFVCPSTGEGKALHQLVRDVRRDWKRLPEAGWSIADLPNVLGRVGVVNWVLTPYPEGTDEHDGRENASSALVAGYALACGVPVNVLRHHAFRSVVDVLHLERPFATLEEFEALLDEVPGAASTAAPSENPIKAYRAFAREAHARLVPFFPEANREICEVYVELELEPELGTRRGHDDRFTVRELLARRDPAAISPRRYAILGDPGAGKTTSARYVVWDLGGAAEPAPVAVYASLPRLLREKKHPFQLAEEAARTALGDVRAAGIAQALFERSRRPDGVWLLLDGLDEVAAEEVDEARRRIASYASELQEGAVAVFSRAIGYRDVAPGFARATLRPLSEERQRALLQHWLGTRGAAETWQRLETQAALRALTGNPLLLTLVASLAMAQPDLPTSRARLYDLALHHLLTRGFGAEPRSVRDVPAARAVLSELALALQRSPSESWTLEELGATLRKLGRKGDAARWRDAWQSGPQFLEEVATVSGILAPHDGSLGDKREPWRFLHRQLREQLAAEALDAGGRKRLEELVGGLKEEDIPRWAETLGLACTLAKEPHEALDFVRRFSAPTARRVLPEVEGLEPPAMLAFLLADPEWVAEDLLRLVRAWIGLGWDATRIQGLVLERLVPGHRDDLNLLGQILWASCEAGAALGREAFFEACGRPVRPASTLDFVALPGGEFSMGGLAFHDEQPVHRVTVSAFELARTIVTRAQFRGFAPERFFRPSKDVSAAEEGSLPADASWWEAYLFCAWIGARLPSEVEWEYACRAGTTSEYSFGDDVSELKEHAWYFVNSGVGVLPESTKWDAGSLEVWGCRAQPVARKKANPWGLHDMHGNMWEWCQDRWHESYEGAPTDASAWVEGASGNCVLRGGSFESRAERARSAFRRGDHPSCRWHVLGFRPARVLTTD
jgi:formylglycine-generating enzyme required for sulfatase activity/cellulose biosynthesis protein BcsQ